MQQGNGKPKSTGRAGCRAHIWCLVPNKCSHINEALWKQRQRHSASSQHLANHRRVRSGSNQESLYPSGTWCSLLEQTFSLLQLSAYSVEKVRKCPVSHGRHTGCWTSPGTLALVIDPRSSAREFFNKICHEATSTSIASESSSTAASYVSRQLSRKFRLRTSVCDVRVAKLHQAHCRILWPRVAFGDLANRGKSPGTTQALRNWSTLNNS